jgi:16S rRNA processing protein RimM
MTGPSERVAVGLVRGLHGLRGAVRVEVLTDHPDERFAPGARVWVTGRPEALTIVEAAPDGKGLRVRFREVPDRNAAEALRDALLEVGLDEVPAPDGDAVWWHELVGVEVRGVDGASLGTVRDVYRVGPAEVLIVDGGTVGPFDLPVVRDFVRAWTPRDGVIVVDADALDLHPRPPARARPPARERRTRTRRGADAGAPSSADEPGPEGEASAPGDEPGPDAEARAPADEPPPA